MLAIFHTSVSTAANQPLTIMRMTQHPAPSTPIAHPPPFRQEVREEARGAALAGGHRGIEKGRS